MKKRKIAIFTGSRAEYGILRPIIRKVIDSPNLDLQLVVSAVHFINKFGSTSSDIYKDKFPVVAKISMTLPNETEGKMGFEVGDGVMKLTKLLLKLQPDILLLTGDRSETFAAAIAGALLPIPVAHIHGGEISKAGIDESMRHAITKLAHLHFATSKKSKSNIIQMGENPENVFLVGAPGLDEFVACEKINEKQLSRKLKIIIKHPLLVILQHPITTSVTDSSLDMRKTLRSLNTFNGTKILIYPNGDPGSEAMIVEIEKYRKKKGLYVFQSIGRFEYINLLRAADVLVGNSSGGIIETASCGLPTVNIGPRQEGRERNTNIVDVNSNEKEILIAITKCLKDQNFISKVQKIRNVYGDGNASGGIVKILSEIELEKGLIQKQFYATKN